MTAAVLLLALGATACGGGGGGGTYGARALAQRCCVAVDDLPGEAVRFSAGDGTRLVGVLLGRGETGIVLVHESSPADLCGWAPYGVTLARRGYRVLLFDLRGLGRSPEPARRAATGRYASDVVGATALLRDRGSRRVFLVGASVGGAAVLVAASLIRPPVSGVVSLAGELDFAVGRGGLTPERAVPRLRSPLLVLVSCHDGYAPVREMRQLVRSAGSRRKRLIVFPGLQHGWDLVERPPCRRRADRAIMAFIEGAASTAAPSENVKPSRFC